MAELVTIGQKDRAFTFQGDQIDHIQVSVKDTLRFTNQDSIKHHIYSSRFDLGIIGTGYERIITLDKAGKIEIECLIHPFMHLTVEISE